MIDAAPPKSDVQPASAGPRIAPNLAENMVKLRALTAVVLDQSGGANEDAKYDAYMQIQRMAVNGQFYGSGAEGRQLLNDVNYSDLGKKIYDINAEYNAAVNATMNRDTGDMGLVMIDLFDGYSADQQRILFDGVISPTLKGDVKRYASVEDWKSNVQAQYQLKDFMEQSKAEPAGKLNGSFAEAERLWKMQDNTSATWTSLVLKLFGNTPSAKVDLSDDARRLVGDVKPSTSTNPYETGAIRSLRV